MPTKAIKDGITYNPDGSIDVVARGIKYTLPSAPLRLYKKIKHMLLDAHAELVALTGHTTAELQAGIGVEDVKAQERNDELKVEIIREVFAGSGKPLPEDVDEWPTWLAVSDDLVHKFLAHWRSIPL